MQVIIIILDIDDEPEPPKQIGKPLIELDWGELPEVHIQAEPNQGGETLTTE